MNLLLIITVAVLGFAAVAGLGFVFAGPTENDKVARRAQCRCGNSGRTKEGADGALFSCRRNNRPPQSPRA